MRHLYYEWFMNGQWCQRNVVNNRSSIILPSYGGVFYHLTCRGNSSFVLLADRILDVKELTDALYLNIDGVKKFRIEPGESVEMTIAIDKNWKVPIRFAHYDGYY